MQTKHCGQHQAKNFVIAAGRYRARTRAPQSVLLTRFRWGTGRQVPHGWAESTSRRNPAKTRQQNAGHTQPGQQHNRIHVHYKLQDNGRLQHQPESCGRKNATGIRNGKNRGTRGNQDNHTPGDLQPGQFNHRGNGKEENKVFRTSQTPGFASAGQMIALCLHCGCLHLRVLVFANACTNGICIAGAEPDKPRQHRGHHPTTQSSPSSQLPHWASRLRTTKGRAAG